VAAVMLVSVAAIPVAGGVGAAVAGDLETTDSGTLQNAEVSEQNVSSDTVLGDVTQTGDIGLTDVILIAEEIAGVRDPNTSFFAPAGDLNRDGRIGLTDGILAREKLAGVPGFDEGEINVSNLSAPDTAQSGTNISVSADLENLGDEGALQDIEFRIAPEGEPLDENATLDQQFVDVAVPGVSDPVDRLSNTTVTFENLTVNLPAGNYTHGVFSEDDNATGTITVEANGAIAGNVTASGDTASAAQTPGAGDPVEGADVTLYEGDSTNATDELETTTTNANGSYEFDQLAPDDYTVEVAEA